jgi:hypothetical protein
MKRHYLSNRVYENYDEIFNVAKWAWNKITTDRSCSICNIGWITEHEY